MADQVSGLGDQGQGSQGAQDSLGWRSALPDEFKDHEYVKTFSKPGDFVRSALEIKTERDGLKTKMDGAIFKPGEDAKPEEVEAFYKSLGRPDKADEYRFEDFQLPENLTTIREYDGAFKTIFHQLGLNGKQAASAHKAILEMVVQQDRRNSELSKDYQDKSMEKLKGEWKDSYNANVELAVRGLKKAGELAGVSDELTKFMNDSRLGDHPLLIKVFHAIGKAISEDTALGTGGLFNKEKDVPRGPDGRPMLRFPSMEK